MLNKFKKYARPISAVPEMAYDFWRYFKYSGWRLNYDDNATRNFQLVKIYHALEKSMSFTNRKAGSGKENAKLLLEIINRKPTIDKGFHDFHAPIVLNNYFITEESQNSQLSSEMATQWEIAKTKVDTNIESPGILNLTKDELCSGMIDNPDKFFGTRHSLREYDSRTVDDSVVKEAIRLAIRTPSVCNRQAWHVYHITGAEKVAEALKYQNGNRGFGHKLESLLIIATDQRAFVSSKEHYQHWIDGGMFSMSLVWALHSLGISSCCLNWSQSGKVDLKLRSSITLNPHHSIIMMLSIGHPKNQNTVCNSPRRPVEEIYTKLL